MDIDDTHSIDHCPNNLPSGNDAFTIAFNVLERVARENYFAIHDAPYDGNRLFASIAYQLESIAACSVDKSTLRQMVVDYLENNSNLYNPYNTDTEPPTAQDAYIETTADHELQMELHWANYVQRLKDGAWGDHIAVQSICEMLQ